MGKMFGISGSQQNPNLCDSTASARQAKVIVKISGTQSTRCHSTSLVITYMLVPYQNPGSFTNPESGLLWVPTLDLPPPQNPGVGGEGLTLGTLTVPGLRGGEETWIERMTNGTCAP